VNSRRKSAVGHGTDQRLALLQGAWCKALGFEHFLARQQPPRIVSKPLDEGFAGGQVPQGGS